MPLTDQLHIAAPNPDGSITPPPGPDDLRRALEARNEELAQKLGELEEILARPLDQILAERDQFKDAAAAWDSFGAMWMLSQRAMKRVALDLAAQQGVSEAEVVSRALDFANDVLNGDGVDLGGTIAEPQMAHIARHRPFLRKQFRRG
jgi:cell division septum initiation protein DivIVA